MNSDNNVFEFKFDSVTDVDMTDSIYDKVSETEFDEALAGLESALNKVISVGRSEVQNEQSFGSNSSDPIISDDDITDSSISSNIESRSTYSSHHDEDDMMLDKPTYSVSSVIKKPSRNDALLVNNVDDIIIKPVVNDYNSLLHHPENNNSNLLVPSQTEEQLIKVETPEVKLNDLLQNSNTTSVVDNNSEQFEIDITQNSTLDDSSLNANNLHNEQPCSTLEIETVENGNKLDNQNVPSPVSSNDVPSQSKSLEVAAPIIASRVIIEPTNSDSEPTNSDSETPKKFCLPSILFLKGYAINEEHTAQSIRIDLYTLRLLWEGEGLVYFYRDFERAFSDAGLNVETHWYDMLQQCFKELRKTKMELYIWFTRRLYEGLSWSDAKSIIDRTLGFNSVKTSNAIKYILGDYKPSEIPFVGYHALFDTCVRSIKYMYNPTIHTLTSADLIALFMKNVVVPKKKLFIAIIGLTKKLYRVKKRNNSLPCTCTPASNTYREDVNGNLISGYPMVFESWEEFSALIKKEMGQLELLERLGEQEEIAKERFAQQQQLVAIRQAQEQEGEQEMQRIREMKRLRNKRFREKKKAMKQARKEAKVQAEEEQKEAEAKVQAMIQAEKERKEEEAKRLRKEHFRRLGRERKIAEAKKRAKEQRIQKKLKREEFLKKKMRKEQGLCSICGIVKHSYKHHLVCVKNHNMSTD